MLYTVKITGHGTIAFRNRATRLPATFNKVSLKDIKLLEVMCISANVNMEIVEKESEILSSVVKKLEEDQVLNIDSDLEIEGTETKIEELFDSGDTLGSLMKNLEKE
jgi:hypothetical protein